MTTDGRWITKWNDDSETLQIGHYIYIYLYYTRPGKSTHADSLIQNHCCLLRISAVLKKGWYIGGKRLKYTVLIYGIETFHWESCLTVILVLCYFFGLWGEVVRYKLLNLRKTTHIYIIDIFLRVEILTANESTSTKNAMAYEE